MWPKTPYLLHDLEALCWCQNQFSAYYFTGCCLCVKRSIPRRDQVHFIAAWSRSRPYVDVKTTVFHTFLNCMVCCFCVKTSIPRRDQILFNCFMISEPSLCWCQNQFSAYYCTGCCLCVKRSVPRHDQRHLHCCVISEPSLCWCQNHCFPLIFNCIGCHVCQNVYSQAWPSTL